MDVPRQIITTDLLMVETLKDKGRKTVAVVDCLFICHGEVRTCLHEHLLSGHMIMLYLVPRPSGDITL